MTAPTSSSPAAKDPVLSSLSEFEFALTIASNAFQRWMMRCMASSGFPGMSALEILVLHLARYRHREKTLNDLCLVLNIEDTHTVSYAVNKLQRLGLVRTGKLGKEKTIATTAKGDGLCDRYQATRQTHFVNSLTAANVGAADISQAASFLKMLAGHYDQAARGAAAS